MDPYRQLVLVAASLLAAVSLHAKAATNYVQDGDFALDAKGRKSDYWTVEFPSAGHGLFNSQPYGADYDAYFLPPASPNGTKTFWESQRTVGGGWNNATYYPGKLSQNISNLLVGHQYSLSFYATANDWLSTTEAGAFAVTFMGTTQNGTSVNSMLGQPGHTGSYDFVPWVLSTMTFTATAGSSTLSLNQVYTGAVPGAAPLIMYLTDIKLTDVTPTVPEPSSVVLTSLGLAAFLLTKRRSKRKQSSIRVD